MNVEGTGFNGENDNDTNDNSEFYQLMIKHQAQESLIKKLKQGNIDSM